MIGGMSFSGSTLPGGSLRRLASALVVLAAFLAAGCDAEPETSSTSERGGDLARSESELDQTSGDAGDESADDDAADDDEAPPSDVELVAPPGGSGPLDPRAEPDPIPWVPRSSSGSHDT